MGEFIRELTDADFADAVRGGIALVDFHGTYCPPCKLLDPVIEQLDFDFVLFSSAIIDYDYIMSLISKYTQPDVPKKEKMSREQLIGLLSSNSNMMDERDEREVPAAVRRFFVFITAKFVSG